MKSLCDIIEDCKLNQNPEYEELFYAVLSLTSVCNMLSMKFRDIKPDTKEFILNLKKQNMHDMYKNALNKSPKEFIGWYELANKINFQQTLFRKLQRFTDENNECDLDWSNFQQKKYYIYYDYDYSKLLIDCNTCSKKFGNVFFSSEEIAQKAIEEFKDELLEYFTKY